MELTRGEIEMYFMETDYMWWRYTWGCDIGGDYTILTDKEYEERLKYFYEMRESEIPEEEKQKIISERKV